MAGIGSVVVQFLAENKMGRTLGDIKKGLSDVEGGSGKANSKIGGLFNTMAGAIPIVGAVAAGVVGAGVALVEMSKAALEDKQSADRLARVLEKIPGITKAMIDENEDWISSMQFATQVSDTELREAVQKLALATGDLGKAQELAALAVDTASASGRNLSAVTDAMARAADGNTASLKRMFPWLDKNEDGTLTYAEAVAGLTGQFKGAAGEASKTKPWETIGIIWDELKESIGGALLPVLGELAKWFQKKEVQDDITDLLDEVSALATEFGEDLLGAVTDLINWLKKPENQQKLKDWARLAGDVASAVGAAASAVLDLVSAMGKIPGAGKLGQIVDWVTPGAAQAAPTTSAGTTAGTHTTAAPQPAPVVMVTEEQIARAVQRLLMRSDARNGRITRIA